MHSIQATTVHPLNIAHAAYLAGLIDGEGTVTLTRLHRNENRRIAVSISNNDVALLQFVREVVGSGKITRKRQYSDRHAQSYHWQINGRLALALLEQVSPYLRTYKAYRANLALKSYIQVTPRNGRYSNELLEARSKFEQVFFAYGPNSAVLGRLQAEPAPP